MKYSKNTRKKINKILSKIFDNYKQGNNKRAAMYAAQLSVVVNNNSGKLIYNIFDRNYQK
jgi:hypothetical protein